MNVIYFQTSMNFIFGGNTALASTLYSVRGGFNGSLLYAFTDELSAGAEIGIYGMADTDNEGNETTLYDTPFRLFARWGKDNTFVQAFAGYYLSSVTLFDGIEVGAKASLMGLYYAGSYIHRDLDYMRFEVGFCVRDLLSQL